MTSILAMPSFYQRQPSKKNAIVNSSTATVHHLAPPSPTDGAKVTASAVRSTSPSTMVSSTSGHPFDARRKAATAHSRPSSISGITEGIGNLNRWSQSTASSKSSATAHNSHNRRNSFARRLSGSFGSLGGFGSSQSPPPNRVLIHKAKPSPVSPQRAPPNAPPSQPPPPPTSTTLPSLPQTGDSANSAFTAASATAATGEFLTPSTNVSGLPDYFGDRRSSRSPQKQIKEASRTPIAPPSNASTRSVRRNVPHGDGQAIALDQSGLNGSPNSSRANSNDKRQGRGHQSQSRRTRNRDEAGKGSGGTEGESSASSVPSRREKGRRRRIPSQKAMLAKALQKANHAVVLDNAQNFEGAMDAYGDACDLLLQVMLRSSGDEDRKKLEAIRNTYRSRIDELKDSEMPGPNIDTKALPERPMSLDSKEQDPFAPITDDDDDPAANATTNAQHRGLNHGKVGDRVLPRALTREQLPPRRQSLMPFVFSEEGIAASMIYMEEQETHPALRPNDSLQDSTSNVTTGLAPIMVEEYMPPPLSPRRPLSPTALERSMSNHSQTAPASFETIPSQHTRQETTESTSWLDTIDESGGSSASSVHSGSSPVRLRRKRIRVPSGATEAEFDAALDAAVEAAYDDGLEPMDDGIDETLTANPNTVNHNIYVSEARKNVDIAKERVREAEREAAVVSAKNYEKRRLLEQLVKRGRSDSNDHESMGFTEGDSDEEERILEEMTKDFIMDDTDYDMRTKSALPRQSDSSGFSGRTWGTSTESNPTSAGTTLSTVAEFSALPWLPNQMHPMTHTPPAYPPPMGALPPPPGTTKNITKNTPTISHTQPNPSRPSSLSVVSGPGVRARRLSGQTIKQLKIDTNTRLPPGMTAPKTQPASLLPPVVLAPALSEPPKSAFILRESQKLLPSSAVDPTAHTGEAYPTTTLLPCPSSSNISLSIPVLTKDTSLDHGYRTPSIPGSPSRLSDKLTLGQGPGTLRKNYSSTSLKNGKVSSFTANQSDDSAGTPLMKVFSAASQSRYGAQYIATETPTPTGASVSVSGMPTGGMHYFDHEIHSPTSPGLPNLSALNAPLPLEPCPESSHLRPFWFLRSVFHTLAQPRGGYLSNRLFVPRDIWRVKNVKLKGVDDKISNLDMLTAALLKLSKVDTRDADAVLEELQSLETVMDQVQALLIRKLGGDVGVQGSAALFKGSPVAEEPGTTSSLQIAKSATSSSKSYLSSWRKLRSKTSTAPGLPLGMATVPGKEGPKENIHTISSLPMTNSLNPRFAKRDVNKVRAIGPNAHYMSALARLCDAVQVLDQIARQVEDPGLKRSSKTHVGLELSTRHAAEFFGFYVCRFVMNDIGLMLDKFIKRGSEWVLA